MGFKQFRSLCLLGKVLNETRPDREVRGVRSFNSKVTGDGDPYSGDGGNVMQLGELQSEGVWQEQGSALA